MNRTRSRSAIARSHDSEPFPLGLSFPLLALGLLLALAPGRARAAGKVVADLVYAEVDGRELHLDLHLPAKAKDAPLVVYIHGGGWRGGSRKQAPWFLGPLAEAGYAVASVEYRFSETAPFPAQIHDCKGAVRWLRAHAGRYGYDASRVAAIGCSAGGHLALLLGLTDGDKRLEGTVGGNLDRSSGVAAVVDFYGPTDFVLRSKDQPQQTDKKGGKVFQLLGGPVQENLDRARLASPAWHVSPGDAPILAFHGTADRTVLINQSERLRDACTQAGVPIALHRVDGAGHGDSRRKTPQEGTGETMYFATRENRGRLIQFLDAHLKKSPRPTGVTAPGAAEKSVR